MSNKNDLGSNDFSSDKFFYFNLPLVEFDFESNYPSIGDLDLNEDLSPLPPSFPLPKEELSTSYKVFTTLVIIVSFSLFIGSILGLGKFVLFNLLLN